MKHQKTLSLLNKANDSKFVTRKWNIVNDNSKANYNVGNEILYNTEVLKSNLCDYNDAYILVKDNITTAGCNLATEVTFKKCAPFTKCITKIDGPTIDDAKNLDFVMPMYNLIEYSPHYSETTGSLWFYSKDEAIDFNAVTENTHYFKSFKYKVKLLENTDNANRILRNATIAVLLKYLSNFWRSIKMPLINCKVQLKLKWRKLKLFRLQLMILLIFMLIILFLLSQKRNSMFL